MNRAERRHLSTTPVPGSVPVTVTREIPVTMMQTAGGDRHTINHDTDEPCYACPCCALWARNLDTLAAAIKEHHTAEHLEPQLWAGECLVCALLAGQADG